jgi:hypothetical protein
MRQKVKPLKQNGYTNGSTNKLFTTNPKVTPPPTNLAITPPIANPHLVPITTTKVPTISKLSRKEFQTMQH